MFGDDFFGGGIDELFNRLAGNSVEHTSIGPDGKRRVVRRTQRDAFGRNLLDKVLSKKRLYFIFDFSGKEMVHASIEDELVQNDYEEMVATGKKVLRIKGGDEVLSESPLSDKIKAKDMETVFKNGILEVSFKR